MTNDRRNSDETELGAFFAAARSEVPAPRTDLLNAILADAADVSAARAASTETARPEPVSLTARLRSVFHSMGGWPATAALACCGVAGFVAGVMGGGDVAQTLIWGDTTAIEYSADTIVNFLDTALAEG